MLNNIYVYIFVRTEMVNGRKRMTHASNRNHDKLKVYQYDLTCLIGQIQAKCNPKSGVVNEVVD